MLEECLTDSVLLHDVYVILNGDLNSRTSNISRDLSVQDNFDIQHKSHSLCSTRRSEDCVLNTYGKLLLNMCTALDLCILNGVCKGDLDGHYTYISESGSSVVDYYILSKDLFAVLYESCELSINERIDSDHLPVSLHVVFPNRNIIDNNKEEQNVVIDKFVWNNDYVQQFHDNLYDEECCAKLDTAINCIDIDVNNALNMFNDCMKEIAGCMRKRICVNNSKI
eukprot:TRINITY_DN15335_c0_g1_i4.p1 TRINITY_DN15335_c0_g1~~TRINITY_DN15335_c0_g1_i4.p1  ORF type:complete len:224 (-),score=17.74 TRINITY_DN15335_c0_g1_i4:246-917(-)